MKIQSLILIALSFFVLAHASEAFGFSNESRTNLPRSLTNLTDPDEQTPPLLIPPTSDQASRNHFDEDHSSSGFVNKNSLDQSTVRGDGSYLQPEIKEKN